jgi:hypothetical protein
MDTRPSVGLPFLFFYLLRSRRSMAGRRFAVPPHHSISIVDRLRSLVRLFGLAAVARTALLYH